MRISTSQIYQRGLDSMLEQQAQLFKTQLQLSSNKRFLSPADDPTAASQVLGLNEAISITEQYRMNIKTVQSRLGGEENALRGAIDALQRARELTVQGSNDTNNAADRDAMATEVRQLIDHVLSLANTRDANGEYIFAGTQTQTKPFSSNGSGVYSYAGDQGQRLLQIAPERQVAVSDSGLDVFMKINNAAGTGYQDIFTTLETLATELEAGNAPSGDRLTEIDNAMENILQFEAKIGARLNTVDQQEDVNSAISLQYQTVRSTLSDLDIAQAATDLNRYLVGLQAAQQSFVKVQGLSLFSYL